MADNKFLDQVGLSVLWSQIGNIFARICRDQASNYNEDFVPEKNQICLVDVSSRGLRVKVGDGFTLWKDLPFSDEYLLNKIDGVILSGYYLNNKFYTDSTYITELEKSVNKIYIDKNSNIVYHFDGTKFISVNETLPTASDVTAGITKLYQDGGENTDGAMSQKAVTNGVQSISFAVDETDAECLILDLPWEQ